MEFGFYGLHTVTSTATFTNFVKYLLLLAQSCRIADPVIHVWYLYVCLAMLYMRCVPEWKCMPADACRCLLRLRTLLSLRWMQATWQWWWHQTVFAASLMIRTLYLRTHGKRWRLFAFSLSTWTPASWMGLSKSLHAHIVLITYVCSAFVRHCHLKFSLAGHLLSSLFLSVFIPCSPLSSPPVR